MAFACLSLDTLQLCRVPGNLLFSVVVVAVVIVMHLIQSYMHAYCTYKWLIKQVGRQVEPSGAVVCAATLGGADVWSSASADRPYHCEQHCQRSSKGGRQRPHLLYSLPQSMFEFISKCVTHIRTWPGVSAYDSNPQIKRKLSQVP